MSVVCLSVIVKPQRQKGIRTLRAVEPCGEKNKVVITLHLNLEMLSRQNSALFAYEKFSTSEHS